MRGRADAERQRQALLVQARVQRRHPLAHLAGAAAGRERGDGGDLPLALDDQRPRGAERRAGERGAGRGGVGPRAGRHRDDREQARVLRDAVAVRERAQRPVPGQLARQQLLEQLAALAVGIRDRPLQVLAEDVAGVGAGDLAVAHQRRGQRERGLAPAGGAAGAVEQRVPEHPVRHAVGVDVVVEVDAGAGAPGRGAAGEPQLRDRDGVLGAQAGELRAVVRPDVARTSAVSAAGASP